MLERKLTLLGAAVFGALLATSAVADYQSPNSADQGVATPQNYSDTSPNHQQYGAGPSVIPSLNNPMSVPEAVPSDAGRQYQSPLVRDSRWRASPITPSASNESNPSRMFDPTNTGGYVYGGTR